jgi:hypothetical protein
MPRYVTLRPRSATWDDLRETPSLEGRTVFEPEAVDTGLLDKGGTPIYRIMDRIGFVRFEDLK